MANQSTSVQELAREVESLQGRIRALHQQTGNEDLEHAALGLEIVHHALEEVAEHTGLSGHIEPTQDAAAHRQAEGWLSAVRNLRAEAESFLRSHSNEDLETAIRALTIAEGSLDEVAERYV